MPDKKNGYKEEQRNAPVPGGMWKSKKLFLSKHTYQEASRECTAVLSKLNRPYKTVLAKQIPSTVWSYSQRKQ